jgi:hypothetical protein
VSLPFTRNKRQYPRVRPDPKAPVEVHIMGVGSLDVVRARDIGVGGVGVRFSHNFAGSDTNAAVELVLILPREEAFIVRGVIRHLSSEGGDHYFGVAFESLTAEHRARIERYVAQRLAEGAAVSSG